MKKILLGTLVLLGLSAEASIPPGRTIACKSPRGHLGVEIKLNFMNIAESAVLFIPYNQAMLGCVVDDREGYEDVKCVGLLEHTAGFDRRFVEVDLVIAGNQAKGGATGKGLKPASAGANDLICSVE